MRIVGPISASSCFDKLSMRRSWAGSNNPHLELPHPEPVEGRKMRIALTALPVLMLRQAQHEEIVGARDRPQQGLQGARTMIPRDSAAVRARIPGSIARSR